jgi:hypothetical protein
LYVDILVAKHEVKQQQEQVQKLINKAKEKWWIGLNKLHPPLQPH